METLLVAVVVSVISPMVLALLTNRQRRAEKREDWARQDLVAKHVEDVAKQAAEAASKVDTVRTDLGAQHVEVSARFDHIDQDNEQIHQANEEIHKLVNSKLTIALEGQLDSLLAQAILMRAEQNITLPGASAALRAVEGRIESLQSTLMDRAEATAEAKP
jgi:hypothetical protein